MWVFPWVPQFTTHPHGGVLLLVDASISRLRSFVLRTMDAPWPCPSVERWKIEIVCAMRWKLHQTDCCTHVLGFSSWRKGGKGISILHRDCNSFDKSIVNDGISLEMNPERVFYLKVHHATFKMTTSWIKFLVELNYFMKQKIKLTKLHSKNAIDYIVLPRSDRQQKAVKNICKTQSFPSILLIFKQCP